MWCSVLVVVCFSLEQLFPKMEKERKFLIQNGHWRKSKILKSNRQRPHNKQPSRIAQSPVTRLEMWPTNKEPLSHSRQKQPFIYKLLTLHIHPPKKHADAAIYSNSSWLRRSQTLPRWHPILAPHTFCAQVLALMIILAGSVFLKQS